MRRLLNTYVQADPATDMGTWREARAELNELPLAAKAWKSDHSMWQRNQQRSKGTSCDPNVFVTWTLERPSSRRSIELPALESV